MIGVVQVYAKYPKGDLPHVVGAIEKIPVFIIRYECVNINDAVKWRDEQENKDDLRIIKFY